MLPSTYETVVFLPAEAGRHSMTKDAPAEGFYENEAGHYVDMNAPQNADNEYIIANTTHVQHGDEDEEEHIYEEIDCRSDSSLDVNGMSQAMLLVKRIPICFRRGE